MEIDYGELLNQSREERKDKIKKFLADLLGENEEDQIKDFQSMIKQIVKVYNDSQYIDFCTLCLEIIYSMDEKSTKSLMEARLEAQFELEDLFERKVDSTNLLKAIQKMPSKDHIIELLKKYGIMP